MISSTHIAAKKDAVISITVSSDVKVRLERLARARGVTLSAHAGQILISEVKKVEAEVRILAEALGLQINEI